MPVCGNAMLISIALLSKVVPHLMLRTLLSTSDPWGSKSNEAPSVVAVALPQSLLAETELQHPAL